MPNIDLNAIFFALFGLGLLVLFVVGFIYFLIHYYKWRGREARSIDSILLQIAVPRNNEIKIDAMEQLFSSLFAIKKGGSAKTKTQPAISFEIVAKPEDIRFYIWVPKDLQDLIEKQVHGAYPDAEIVGVQEYNIFTKEGKVAHRSLQLSGQNYYPLKTYRDLPTDPMATLTSAMAKMGEGEAAALQVLISPSESSWQSAGTSFISETKKQEADPEKAKYAVPAKQLEAVENKVGKPGFETSVRIVVVSGNQGSADVHLANIEAAFAQFSGDLNSFKSRVVRRKGAFIEDFIYRYPPMFHLFGNRVSVLNSEELATIFHFPNKQVTTPHLYWLYAKTAPAPSEIAQKGLYLGMSTYRGVKRPVHISDDDRLRHMYIIGK
ncbi:MAG: hypothetical protein ACC618_00295, partial [Patescibacteria group bacterium]